MAQSTKSKPVLFGLFNVLIILLASWLTWYLLIDPTGPLGLYPNKAGGVMFWIIIGVVWFAFNGELYWFRNLSQPTKGIILVALTTALSVFIVWFLNVLWGSWSPVFSIDRPPSNFGAFAGALFVLPGFFVWPVLVLTWQHWPWSDSGMKQPYIGIVEFFVGFFITFFLFLFLVFPALAMWPSPDWFHGARPLFTIPTFVGWFYMVPVVHLIITGLFERWPWRLMDKNRARMAIVSFFGIVALASLLYPIMLNIAKLLMGPAIAELLSQQGMLNIEAAQLGVCFITWVIIWPIIGSNWPTKFPTAVNYIVRLLITFALGVIFYVFMNRWFGVILLHEPSLAILYGATLPGYETYGGNPLLSIDWVIVMALYYLVYFDSWGLRRLRQG